MIYLKTGLPGSGKTLSLVEAGAVLAKEGRRVFYEGISEVDEAKLGIRRFAGELQDWARLLETGDVLLVDEITRYPELCRGGTRTRVPAWVEELTRNRHYGIDLYLCTQDPKNADSFVRRLVNQHEHYVNKFGAEESVVYTWPECVDDIEIRGNRDRADKRVYKYPKELYGAYKSAELHTRKKYTPRRLKLAYASFVVAALCVALAGVAVFKLWHRSAPAVAPQKIASADPGDGLFSTAGGKGKHTLSKAEWVAQMEPRISGFMWSEPLFDGQKVQAQPETYCMAIENGPCRCISDQGTRIKMDQDTCRLVALEGMYNPFRRPVQEMRQAERPRERVAAAEGRQPDERIGKVESAGEAAESKAHHKPLSSPYDPSEMGPRSTQY